MHRMIGGFVLASMVSASLYAGGMKDVPPSYAWVGQVSVGLAWARGGRVRLFT